MSVLSEGAWIYVSRISCTTRNLTEGVNDVFPFQQRDVIKGLASSLGYDSWRDIVRFGIVRSGQPTDPTTGEPLVPEVTAPQPPPKRRGWGKR